MLQTRAYFDHNSTTPPRAEVVSGVREALEEVYANASSIHQDGQRARHLVEQARRSVAALLGADAREIVFTSGGTEADNTAVFGAVAASDLASKHVVTSTIEHPAVLNACQRLEQLGVAVSYLPVGASGVVDPDDVRRALRNETALVTVMHANNEIGTLQPVEEIGRICAEAGVPLHVDGVQAVGKIPVTFRELGATFYAVSAHKLQGPKGVGALVAGKGSRFQKLLYGGSHERNRRPGTENVPGIHGLGIAASMAQDSVFSESDRIARLRNDLETGILRRIPDVLVNGGSSARLPNTSNLSILGVEGEPLVIALDLRGFAISSGAACSSGSVEPSHVLTAIGLSPKDARSSIRISLGWDNTEVEVSQFVDALEEAVRHLRRVAPAQAVAAQRRSQLSGESDHPK